MNVVAGAFSEAQKYKVPPTRSQAINENFRVDWGVTLKEAIDDVSATSAAEQECTILRIDDIAEQVSHAFNRLSERYS